MENPTRVSVVMTAYNSSQYIRKSIESILNQSFIYFEFIIVNDYSTDNTLEIIESYKEKDERIVLVNNEVNLGVSKSCNYVIKEIAKGDLIIRMDSDDIAKVTRIEKLVEYLESYPDVIAVGSNADFIDMEGKYIFTSDLPLTNSSILKSLEHRATLINPTVAFRKKEFLDVGGYYEPIKHYFEDYMLWYQFSKIGKINIIKDSLLEYRVVMNSISTKSVSKKYKELEKKIVKKGYATTDELDFIMEEKSLKSTQKEGELAYYLILSQKYLLDNYDLAQANKNLKLASLIDPFSKRLKLLIMLSYCPKIILRLLFKIVRK